MKNLSLFLFFALFSIQFCSAQTLEEKIYSWDIEENTEKLKSKLDAFGSSKSDENNRLVLKAIYEGKIGNSIKRIELLVQLAENNKNKNNFYSAYSNYHLACILNLYKISPFALEFSDKAIEYSKAINNKRILYLSYKIKAGTYYQLKNYTEAKKNFELAKNSGGQDGTMEKASDFNNIALCYTELGQNNLALQQFSEGINLLKKKRDEKNEPVYQLIQGNMGTIYVKQQHFEAGKKLLLEELNFYRDHNRLDENYISTLLQLIDLAQQSNNREELTSLSQELFTCLNTVESNTNRLSAIETLLSISGKQPIGISETALNVLHNRILIDQLTEQSKLHDGLTGFLYEEKIKTIVDKASNDKQAVEESEQNSRSKFVFALIICIAFIMTMAAGYFVLRFRIDKNRKELAAKTENEELIKRKQQSLERDVENQQQQLNLLLTNLKIKQQTESGFLEKIKDLKRNRNATTEQVIQELQLGLANLFEIDKKLITESPVEMDLNTDLGVRFKNKHPELSESELTMCSYFVSELTAKEIGLLLNISDISVRVAKNKIKKKIGLSKESNLNEYLQSLLS